jgi:hypothetical protein
LTTATPGQRAVVVVLSGVRLQVRDVVSGGTPAVEASSNRSYEPSYKFKKKTFCVAFRKLERLSCEPFQLTLTFDDVARAYPE